MRNDKQEQAIRSSAAEYLTFVAATGDSTESMEMRYEDENIWLTQKMMSALYDVDVRTINEHIQKIYEDGELTDEATIRNFRIVQTEGILAALGIPASNAINMFYKQIILQRGLPFEVKMPSARPVGISALSEAQMNAELEKGYADMQAGRTRSAKSVFADIRKDYNL